MIFSSLPFEVNLIEENKKFSKIAISYWGTGPDSFHLATRVKSSLANKLKKYGIKKITAEFNFLNNCYDKFHAN